jgi:hypothetical protein
MGGLRPPHSFQNHKEKQFILKNIGLRQEKICKVLKINSFD